MKKRKMAVEPRRSVPENTLPLTDSDGPEARLDRLKAYVRSLFPTTDGLMLVGHRAAFEGEAHLREDARGHGFSLRHC
ncbi:MAG: hypothetical protein NTY66_03735 [Candidatus Vogelbacteria bacterium]|nr:hypothetical protein [Candidatus Vogelbacteria bacterium]